MLESFKPSPSKIELKLISQLHFQNISNDPSLEAQIFDEILIIVLLENLKQY